MKNTVGEILETLKQKGFRITMQREEIIKRIAESDKLLSANEIWQKVMVIYPNIALDTIYRNINMLVAAGVLIPVGGLGKEGTRFELSGQHHHHILCAGCGQAVCLHFCPISKEFVDLLREHGYRLLKHNIELIGLCDTCNKHGGREHV